MSTTFTSTYILCLCCFLVSPSSGWWTPAPRATFDIQLSTPIDPNITVASQEIDLFLAPQSLIDTLHAQGKIVVCYFSGGSFEKGRPDSQQFPSTVLGKVLDGWPDEKWLDIRQISLLAPIMTARMDLAVQKRCDAVDPDNVDGFENNSGFKMTADDQLAYNRWLAMQAHQRNLSIALKNDVSQLADLVTDFDFAVNEECFRSGECPLYKDWIAAGKPVMNIEYTGSPSSFCSTASTYQFTSMKKGRDLAAGGQFCLNSSFGFTPGWTQAPSLIQDLQNYTNNYNPDSAATGRRAAYWLLVPFVLLFVFIV